MTTDTKFNLIAYKPSSSRWEGCHCHGSDHHFDSAIKFFNNLSESELEEKIYETLMLELEEGEDGYEFGIYANGQPVYSQGSNMYGFDAGYDDGVEEQPYYEICERIFQRANERATKAREAAAAEEKEALKRQEQETLERERKKKEEQERAQFEALKAKFGTK